MGFGVPGFSARDRTEEIVFGVKISRPKGAGCRLRTLCGKDLLQRRGAVSDIYILKIIIYFFAKKL
jgi:hypothetical protein